MKTNQSISFHYLVEPFYFPKREEIKAFLAALFKDHKKKPEALNYIFCSDKYLLSINQQYLNHDYYTDVIAFDLSTSPSNVTADIYISIDRARENAQQFAVPTFHEVMRLLIHSSLHLCGYKDKKAKDVEEMKKAENTYLDQFFVSRGT